MPNRSEQLDGLQRANGEIAPKMAKVDHAKGENCPTPAQLRAFFCQVEKPAGVDGCWIWRGGTNGDGYAQNSEPVHRRAYRWMVGPIPEGLELDHLCRERACVNPHHLEPVTHAENMRRSRAALLGSVPQFVPRHYCRRGHALVGSNARVWSDGPGRTKLYCYLCHDGERSGNRA